MTHDSSLPPTPTPEAPEPRPQEVDRPASALFQHAPNAAILLGRHGRILDVNARACEVIGAEHGALVGRRLGQVLAPPSQVALAGLLERVFGTGTRQEGEVQVPAEVDGLRDLHAVAALHEGPGGPVCHLSLTDVTSFKRAHRTLLDVNQTQSRRLQAHEQHVRRLNEEFESIVFASDREVLERVARVETLLAHQRLEAPSESLEHVEEALRQTRDLLHALNRYMRMRKLRVRMRPVDLKQVWREVLLDAQDQLAGRDVRITSAALPVVHGDTQVLQIILGEFVSNALTFTRTRPQARIHVWVRELETEYHIGVQDNGVGFNLRYRDRAFEIFGRLHPAGQGAGVGVGLAVVRRLCERFGGRAWGEGKPEQGATFWIAWPRVPSVE